MILLLGGAILTAGDIVMKKWAVTTDWRLLSLGMLLWIGGLCCLATTIKHQNIAVASTVLVLSNVTILAVVEWRFFGNELSFMQIGGLLFGAGTICLLAE